MTDTNTATTQATAEQRASTETNASEQEQTTTQQASSEGGEGEGQGQGQEQTEAQQKPEPTAEELAATARAVVPETAEAYQVNLADDAREALGLVDNDPLVAGLTKYAAENKKPQGYVDDVLEAAAELQRAGLFDAGLDPAAEAAALGENAEGRRREVEVFGEALKTRGDITEAEYGELMSLAPTAAGVTLIEKLRKMMVDGGQIKPPGDAPDPLIAAKAKAAEMRADPRYDNDRAFRAQADQAFKDAYPGAR